MWPTTVSMRFTWSSSATTCSRKAGNASPSRSTAGEGATSTESGQQPAALPGGVTHADWARNRLSGYQVTFEHVQQTG
jgi:hypothetical protein